MLRSDDGQRASRSITKTGEWRVRSLPIDQWPVSDRLAWIDACRPGERLKRGGSASHLKPLTRDDLARRYGYFLDHIDRTEGLVPDASAASYVTPDRVQRFIAELQARVGSVTVYGSVYKLRRTAQLLVPDKDFAWLAEIEKDLDLVKQPRSKFGRLVYTEVIVEAGMTLMAEAEATALRSALACARQFRNGLMIALLALCPIRLKNFSALEIGRNFTKIKDAWWIVLPAGETKEKRADERRVPTMLASWIDQYIQVHRPALLRENGEHQYLWVSSIDGTALTYSGAEAVISKVTQQAIGVSISPHLFRTAAASTAAAHGGKTPHLASALLHHTDPAVTEEHYNRASSQSAAQAFADVIRTMRKP